MDWQPVSNEEIASPLFCDLRLFRGAMEFSSLYPSHALGLSFNTNPEFDSNAELREDPHKAELPDVKDSFILMIRERMEIPFVVLFNEHVVAKSQHHSGYGDELGCLAVDHHCQNILKCLGSYYNSLTWKFWQNHAIWTNNLVMFAWMAEHIRIPDKTCMVEVIKFGHYDMIDVICKANPGRNILSLFTGLTLTEQLYKALVTYVCDE